MSAQPKITVEPEGRDGIWLAHRDSLKAYIESKGWEYVHNFMPSDMGLVLNADHEVAGVLRDIDRADKVAVLTGEARRENLNHALALIMPPEGPLPERLAMFDIGDVEADLEPCPTCNGDGWVIDHDEACYEAGDCIGCGGRQVRCDDPRGHADPCTHCGGEGHEWDPTVFGNVVPCRHCSGGWIYRNRAHP